MRYWLKDCSLNISDYKFFNWFCKRKDSNIIINLEQLVIIFLEVVKHGFVKYFTFS